MYLLDTGTGLHTQPDRDPREHQLFPSAGLLFQRSRLQCLARTPESARKRGVLAMISPCSPVPNFLIRLPFFEERVLGTEEGSAWFNCSNMRTSSQAWLKTRRAQQAKSCGVVSLAPWCTIFPVLCIRTRSDASLWFACFSVCLSLLQLQLPADELRVQLPLLQVRQLGRPSVPVRLLEWWVGWRDICGTPGVQL